MKTELTKEQSQHLIDLGVPEKMASCELVESMEQVYGDKPRIKIFTQTDLLEMLPKYIDCEVEGTKYAADFVFFWNNRFLHYEAGYDLFDMWDKSHRCTDELIDALYELTVWCIANGYLKFDI